MYEFNSRAQNCNLQGENAPLVSVDEAPWRSRLHPQRWGWLIFPCETLHCGDVTYGYHGNFVGIIIDMFFGCIRNWPKLEYTPIYLILMGNRMIMHWLAWGKQFSDKPTKSTNRYLRHVAEEPRRNVTLVLGNAFKLSLPAIDSIATL